MIRDSTIWLNSDSYDAINDSNNVIRIGIVKEAINDVNGDIRYVVQVFDKGYVAYVACKPLRRFGGAYNYEDYINRGYEVAPTSTDIGFTARAGDAVVVGQLNGKGSDGIILGAITHPARDSSTFIKASEGPQYKSVFNGLMTNINNLGEWTVTFMGQPTNLSVLKAAASAPLPAPVYDANVGSSYMKFDKTGGYTVSDNANANPQSIKIDKAAGTITVTSGKVVLTINKATESVALTSKSVTVNASESVTETTKTHSLKASTSVSINSPKVAIGTQSIELLDQLVKLIDKLGTVIPISPIGPCAPLQSTPQWSLVLDIQSKIKSIKGSIS